jgi:site-specific DNA recombinase
MVCGACDGGFSKISAAHFGCSTARNKGPTACTNLLTVRRDILEETVLGALRERLMDPDLFRAFVTEFTVAWNRLQAEASAGLTGKRAELERVRGQIERAVDAIVAGTASSSLKARLEELEQRKAALETELARVLKGDDAAEAREVVRGLVEAIRIRPETAAYRDGAEPALCFHGRSLERC